MPDMWSRSCSILVIPKPRGFELSGRLEFFFSSHFQLSNTLILVRGARLKMGQPIHIAVTQLVI